jgi:hypothetical protein
MSHVAPTAGAPRTSLGSSTSAHTAAAAPGDKGVGADGKPLGDAGVKEKLGLAAHDDVEDLDDYRRKELEGQKQVRRI